VGREEARFWVDEQLRLWIAAGISPAEVGPGLSWWQLREALAAWLVLHGHGFEVERVTIGERREAAE